MLGMHPLSAYFGTSPDLGDLATATKYVTTLAGAEHVVDNKGREKITAGLGLHVMLCKPGSKEPFDIRTDREKKADQEEWTAYREALRASGKPVPAKEQHPGGLYVATNNTSRLKKYLTAAAKLTQEARTELTLLTTRDLFATVLAEGGDTSSVSPEQLADLRDQHAQIVDEVEALKEAKPKKNTKDYRRLTLITPLAEMTPLAEHERARIHSLNEQLKFPFPNLAVSVGPSNVVVVDCDTAKEVQAFQRWAARLSGDDNWLRTKPTVSSPGVHRDGSWKHKDGGHYWFMLPRPEGIVVSDENEGEDDAQRQAVPADTRRVLHHDSALGAPEPKITMEPIPEEIATTVTVVDDLDQSVKFDIFVNKHYVLLPPSVRPEGEYLSTGPSHDMPEWLYRHIMSHGHKRAEQAEARRLWREGRGPLPDNIVQDIQSWYQDVPWSDILLPKGWQETGTDSCGCPIWQRPGGSSYKSATAHQPGCSQHPGSMDPPIHFWTSDPGEEIIDKIQSIGGIPGAGSGSLSKLQLTSALYFGGDDGEALKHALGEGFSGQKVTYEFTNLFPERTYGLLTVNTIVDPYDPDEYTDEDSDIELMALPTSRTSGQGQTAYADPAPQPQPTQADVQAQINQAGNAHLDNLAQSTAAYAPQGQGQYTGRGQHAGQGQWGAPAANTGAGEQDIWSTSGGTAPMAAGMPAPAPQWPQVSGPDGQGQTGFDQPQQGYAPQQQGYAPQPQGYAPQPQQGYAPQPMDDGGVPRLPIPAVNPLGPVQSDMPQLPRPDLHSAQGSGLAQGLPAGSGVGPSPQFPGSDAASLAGSVAAAQGNPYAATFGNGAATAATDFSLFQGVDGYVDTTGGGADEDETSGYDGATLPVAKAAPFFFKHNIESETAPPFKSLDTLMAELPPVEFLVKSGRNGLIQDRALTVVAGPSNAGKSAVLLDMLCTMAAEQTPDDGKFGIWMNAMTKRRNILYVAGEGIAGVVNRVAAWEANHERSVRQHMSFTDEAFPFNAPESAWQDFANRIVSGGYQVIVFDTMATMMTGLEENSNDDMGRVMSWLHRLVDRTRAAVILVHHTGKSAENMTPRGASALTAAISSQLLVTKRELSELDQETQRKFEDEGITPIRLTVTKQKDSGYADPLDLSLVRVKVPHRPGLSETDDFDQDYGHQTVLVGDNEGKIVTRHTSPAVVSSVATPRGYVSDTKALAIKILARALAVGAGPEKMRQTSELTKSKLKTYISAQWGMDTMETLSAAQFSFEFSNAVTLCITSGALREDGTMLHPNVDHFIRKDRDKATEILTERLNGASADDARKDEGESDQAGPSLNVGVSVEFTPGTSVDPAEPSEPTEPTETAAPDLAVVPDVPDADEAPVDESQEYGMPEDDFDPSDFDGGYDE